MDVWAQWDDELVEHVPGPLSASAQIGVWFIAFVLLKHGPTAGNVTLYDKFVVPLMKRVEQRLTPFIGKNILLVAQKTRQESGH